MVDAVYYTPREMLARLVAYDTTSRNSNLELITFVEDYLASHGVASRRIEYQPGKMNLFATIGPTDRGGIILSGHSDVVPVDGQDWTVEPFVLSERDGRLYGRGTSDMKGFIATALALTPAFKARPLKTPIHLAISCEEETGCRGVRPMIEALGKILPTALGVIVGEPTNMKVIDTQKGIASFITEVRGLEGHSSEPARGVNAIFAAGHLVVEMERIALALRSAADSSSRFDAPYTTLHVGVISGGTAKNIIPGRCAITWEMRLLPGASPDEAVEQIAQRAALLETEMKKISPLASIVTRQINAVPALHATPGSVLQALIMKIVRTNKVYAASYATEASLFQHAGMDALICGPGSIEQAHKADEYIEVDQIEQCTRFLRELASYCETDLRASHKD